MINSNDFGYLVHLLKCALNGSRPNEKPDNVSFENVFNGAIKHDVANLAFYAVEKLENKPEYDLYDNWRQVRELAVIRDIYQGFAYDELCAELQKAGIRRLEIQGTVVKRYYPQPDMRTMSDIDFVVDKENLAKIKPILEKLGYESDCHIEEIDAHKEPKINLEFHAKVFDTKPFTDCFANAFENAKSKDGTAYYFSNSDFYVYNMFHLLKHLFYVNGCGIRRFCDIYLLNKALKGSLDREYIHSMYEKYGVSDKAEAVERLADALFGDSVFTDDLQAMYDELMNSAVHGTTVVRAKNDLNNIIKDGKRFAKLRYWLNRVFPPYEKMVWTYPQLKNKKALTPIYYLRRIFRIVFKERHRIKRACSAIKKADKEMKNG